MVRRTHARERVMPVTTSSKANPRTAGAPTHSAARTVCPTGIAARFTWTVARSQSGMPAPRPSMPVLATTSPAGATVMPPRSGSGAEVADEGALVVGLHGPFAVGGPDPVHGPLGG